VTPSLDLQEALAQLAHTRRRLEVAHRLPSRPRPPLSVRVLEPERGPLRMLPPEALLLDPPRFQFRLSAGADGTTGRLEGCPVFRLELCGALLAWVDPSDGSGPWLIDGHHRRALALADGAPLVPVLLVEATTAGEARAVGALSNVAHGTASSPDLCRLLRDLQEDPRTLARRYGLQRNSRVVSDARALLALEADLFARCSTGELSLEQALALAAAPDHTLQRRLWAMATARGWDASQTMEAAHLAQLVPQQQQAPAGCIPGLEALMSEANPLLDEQLAIRAAIRRLLRIENRAVRVVGHHRAAEALERRGVATIDQQAALEVKAESGALLDRFAVLAGHSGALAEAIAAMAQEVADGADLTRLVEANMPTIRAILSRELT
jgi:ParB-like chromosome segregation protein Spo0J